ncbi:ATP-dependent DNA helicase [Halobacteriales archaeon QS_1_68_20]|nr:MAG: ATP-dependent DNA helicase [Halobacteriales archaeon QS_1_68_20]
MSDSEERADPTADPDVDPRWRAIFGHDEPYDQQADGIEAAVAAAQDSGYAVVEGACGTGKTMLALTAGLHLVRDPDSDFERVVVLTSVKQQLRQFEEDLRTINANLPEDWRPFSGLTLVGKADVCPYARENAAGIDRENVYDRCETLRDAARGLTGEGGATTAQALAGRARSQQVGLADSGEVSDRGQGAAAADYLETADSPAPYAPDLPEYDGTEYCPFYAQFLEELPEDGDPVEAVPFEFEDAGLLTTEGLVARSVEHGTCPHSMMGALLANVEVVVGNYYHAFDPVTTASFTAPLLDDSTFVVCDEAHMLEPRVRELVSDGVADATLRDAETELTRVIQPLEAAERGTGNDVRPGPDAVTPDLASGELADTDLDLPDLKRVRAFVRDLREELDRRVTAHLDREYPAWRSNLGDLNDEELPLRDPETPEPDALSEWASREGYEEVWMVAEPVGAVVGRILDEAEDEQKDRAAAAAGRVLAAWRRRGHERYFREIELERTWDETHPADSWRRAYNARLSLQDCVPGEAIAGVLDEFGGGVLMSATLRPFDAFETVTGLSHLADDGRPVVERTYGLAFPEENRASFAVDVPKFTYDNRGDPRDHLEGEDNRVREAYADRLAEVARSPGNVLVGMPSYREAEWAASVLRERVEKPVLLDESSDDATTEELKDDFFAGESKVLVTSLRGTLTEGVDYRGDRLSAAVVCGVPIVNTASPRTRAVRAAYDRQFGDGFRHALLVPAVRKARQALGRVIRGPDERGVRVLLDGRYARESWDSVRGLLPPAEREEFQPVSPDMLSLGLDRFWG